MNKKIYTIPMILSFGFILSGCAVDGYHTTTDFYASPGSSASVTFSNDPFYDNRFYSGNRYYNRYYNHPFYNNRLNDPFWNFHYNGTYNNFDRYHYGRPPIIIHKPRPHHNRPDRPNRPHRQ